MEKKQIIVLPTGYTGADDLTMRAVRFLHSGKKMILRTGQHYMSEYLESEKISYSTLDEYYDRYEDFDSMHQAMAKHLWQEAENETIIYIVMDTLTDGSVLELVKSRKNGEKLEILPGISAVDRYLSNIPDVDITDGIVIKSATALLNSPYDPDVPLLITEIDSPILAGDVKLWVMDHYGENHPVVFFASSLKGMMKHQILPIEEIDRQKHYNHTVAVLLPVVRLLERNHFSFNDLNKIMDRLRGENGCPWDRIQTHDTLKQYLIEEAWEAACAIDENDVDQMADELGDLLFQIVFHASVGKTFEEFTVQDILDSICRKMIRRHTHVFGADHCDSPGDVTDLWEKNKQIETGNVTAYEKMKHVPEGMPALKYTAKVLKYALQDPDINIEDSIQNMRKNFNDDALALFEIVLHCRKNGTDPELLLHDLTRSFIKAYQDIKRE